MSAGFKYKIDTEPSIEERYDVSTGIRRRGAYRLDTANLGIGQNLPSFIPICADLKTKKCNVVRNVQLTEDYVSGANSLKVKKGSFVYRDMHIGNGVKGTTISAIDKSNPKYDVLTISDLGINVGSGSVLFEAKEADGLVQKYVANSALYESRKVEEGNNLIALLSAAREIEPEKLIVPFSANDKEKLGSNFQFNE